MEILVEMADLYHELRREIRNEPTLANWYELGKARQMYLVYVEALNLVVYDGFEWDEAVEASAAVAEVEPLSDGAPDWMAARHRGEVAAIAEMRSGAHA